MSRSILVLPDDSAKPILDADVGEDLAIETGEAPLGAKAMTLAKTARQSPDLRLHN